MNMHKSASIIMNFTRKQLSYRVQSHNVAFSVTGPDIWNSQSPQIRLTVVAQNFDTFKKKAKTIRFGWLMTNFTFISVLNFEFTHSRNIIMAVVLVFRKLGSIAVITTTTTTIIFTRVEISNTTPPLLAFTDELGCMHMYSTPTGALLATSYGCQKQ